MGIRETKVSSLGELIDRVTPERPDERTGRRRDSCVYHGSADAARTLLTSLDRLGGVSPPHTKTDLEEYILRNFARYSRPHLQHATNEWELLVAAQHHGVPTRLLDWSYSPLIAAHFATLAGPPESDKVVWRLNWRLVHEHFDLPPVAFLVQELDAMLQARGIQSLGELMARPHLGEARFVCMLDPPALDDRIIAQSATFTISTDKTRSFEQILGEEGLSHALTRYLIPKERLNYVRDQLDLCALDERKLFPDLDGVAAQLRRYYSPSGRRDDSADPGIHHAGSGDAE